MNLTSVLPHPDAEIHPAMPRALQIKHDEECECENCKATWNLMERILHDEDQEIMVALNI